MFYLFEKALLYQGRTLFDGATDDPQSLAKNYIRSYDILHIF